MKKKRERFKVNCVGSSRGVYVRNTHRAFIKEVCESAEHRELIAKIEIEVKVTPRYYVRCFGKIMEVTEREAMMLGDLAFTM